MDFLLSSLFLLSWFPASWTFPCAGFSSLSASTTGASLSWAPAALGLFCAEVVSARLNPSHGTIMLGKCMLLDFCLVTTNVWRERR